jgi:hypothetical protein
MHGFASNVLSCEERERLGLYRKWSTLRGVPEKRSEAFPGGLFGCGRSQRLHCMDFLLFSTEV